MNHRAIAVAPPRATPRGTSPQDRLSRPGPAEARIGGAGTVQPGSASPTEGVKGDFAPLVTGLNRRPSGGRCVD
jgi:hypothetical protein